MNTTAIKLRLMKEDKSGLFYLLRILNHQKYFYGFEESYSKKELQEKALEEIGNFHKLKGIQTYKDLF